MVNRTYANYDYIFNRPKADVEQYSIESLLIDAMEAGADALQGLRNRGKLTKEHFKEILDKHKAAQISPTEIIK